MRKLAVRAVLAILLAPALASCAAMGDVAQAAYVSTYSPKAAAAMLVSQRLNAQMACRDCKRQCVSGRTQLDIAKCRIACDARSCCRHGEGPI